MILQLLLKGVRLWSPLGWASRTSNNRGRQQFREPGLDSNSPFFPFLISVKNSHTLTKDYTGNPNSTLPETLRFLPFKKKNKKTGIGSTHYYAHTLILIPLILKIAYKSEVLFLCLSAKEESSTLREL